MKKGIKFLVIILAWLLIISVVSAGMIIPANDRAKEKAKAPEKSPVINEGWELERIDFIHYAKPNNTGKPGKPPKGPKEPSCYKLMGVKWKSLPVDYTINPTNYWGLNENFVVDAISISVETWDGATSSELFDNVPNVNYSAWYGYQDFNNVISFGDYLEEGVIGVTSVWYIPRGKKIVEFDILLDVNYTWGDASVNSSVMDLQNIAIHELGHAVGLDDIYADACSEVTMYGYSTEGETKKRTLEQPDIAGIRRLYG